MADDHSWDGWLLSLGWWVTVLGMMDKVYYLTKMGLLGDCHVYGDGHPESA